MLTFASPADTFGVHRKFQTGKSAKKAAQLFADAKARQDEFNKANGHGDVNAEAEAMRALRGPSLLDQHLQNKAAAGSSDKKQSSGGRTPFDRERVRRSCACRLLAFFTYSLACRRPLCDLIIRLITIALSNFFSTLPIHVPCMSYVRVR